MSFNSTKQHTKNINDYKNVIQNLLTGFILEQITIDRFGLTFQPWDNWNNNQNPLWWGSYNNVKHERNNHFSEANLRNTINAMGALLLTVIYYYKHAFANEAGHDISFRDTTSQLQPESTLLRVDNNYYYHHLII